MSEPVQFYSIIVIPIPLQPCDFTKQEHRASSNHGILASWLLTLVYINEATQKYEAKIDWVLRGLMYNMQIREFTIVNLARGSSGLPGNKSTGREGGIQPVSPSQVHLVASLCDPGESG